MCLNLFTFLTLSYSLFNKVVDSYDLPAHWAVLLLHTSYLNNYICNRQGLRS